MFAKPNWLMPMTAYMNIRRSSSMPRLAMEGSASTNVLKMIWSFLNRLKILRILPILSERRIVAVTPKFPDLRKLTTKIISVPTTTVKSKMFQVSLK